MNEFIIYEKKATPHNIITIDNNFSTVEIG